MNIHRKRVGSLLSGAAASTAKDPLSLALERLSEVLSQMGQAKPPVVNIDVPDSSPDIVVNVPEPKGPKKMRFTINRDRDGRISSIDAETK